MEVLSSPLVISGSLIVKRLIEFKRLKSPLTKDQCFVKQSLSICLRDNIWRATVGEALNRSVAMPTCKHMF